MQSMIKKIHEKNFTVPLYKCTLHILKQSSGFDECDFFNYWIEISNFYFLKFF